MTDRPSDSPRHEPTHASGHAAPRRRALPDKRTLLGPGPSDLPPPVLRALSHPVVGHLDGQYLALMDRVRVHLREVWATVNEVTLALPGTGTSGMEACFANLLEPGDSVLIGVAGYFGARMVEVAERHGAHVHRLEVPWGEAIPAERAIAAIRKSKPKAVALVHAETSTGVWQDVTEIFAAAREQGALTILDCVTSLGGVPVEIDAWGVDAAYSCTQKCLGCPPGLAPVTFSARAMQRIRARKIPVHSFYLDLDLHAKYWGTERVYHHTAPASLVYALHEGLELIHEEGLQARFARHRRNHQALVDGLEAMGLSIWTRPELRLPTLHAVSVPEGVDEAAVRRDLIEQHAIEIGAGLGPLKGQIWRVGLMGASSTSQNVLLVLAALEQALHRVGAGAFPGGTVAAIRTFRAAGSGK